MQIEEFSVELNRYEEDVRCFSKALLELRYLSALAQFFRGVGSNGIAISYPCPLNSSRESEIRASKLINPNLLLKMNSRGVVANDVMAIPERNVFVVTGPNNNAKTVFLNSIGLIQLMTQAGWLVLADEAEVGIKDNVFSHYIRPSDIRIGESRFANELSRIRGIINRATEKSLILFDEPCTGTSPVEGEEEANVVLKGTAKIGATVFMATHFFELSKTAEQMPYGDNLHCVVDSAEGPMENTYKIEKGASNISNAQLLAEKVGIDAKGIEELLEARVARGEIKHLRS